MIVFVCFKLNSLYNIDRSFNRISEEQETKRKLTQKRMNRQIYTHATQQLIDRQRGAKTTQERFRMRNGMEHFRNSRNIVAHLK